MLMDKVDDYLVFITPAGQRWVRVWTGGKPMVAHADLEILARVSRVDRVTNTMAQLLGKLELARRGHTFYALRNTCYSGCLRTRWKRHASRHAAHSAVVGRDAARQPDGAGSGPLVGRHLFPWPCDAGQVERAKASDLTR